MNKQKDKTTGRFVKTISLEERFWSKVDKGDGCWLWRPQRNKGGYGYFQTGTSKNQRPRRAHIVAYELVVGRVPKGLELDHLCENPPCVNPAHLEPVTGLENRRRSGGGWGGANYRKTHCPKGHEYNEENTYRNEKGRACRVCHKEVERKRRLKKRNQ